jgi:hypothetical protein
LNSHKECHHSWERTLKFVINLVCRIKSKVSSCPESSEFPDHDCDKPNQKDKEDENVNNGQNSGLAHFGTPLEIN